MKDFWFYVLLHYSLPLARHVHICSSSWNFIVDDRISFDGFPSYCLARVRVTSLMLFLCLRILLIAGTGWVCPENTSGLWERLRMLRMSKSCFAQVLRLQMAPGAIRSNGRFSRFSSNGIAACESAMVILCLILCLCAWCKKTPVKVCACRLRISVGLFAKILQPTHEISGSWSRLPHGHRSSPLCSLSWYFWQQGWNTKHFHTTIT